MGEASKIEWTDATVNFWWGCTKVGPGCEHCYAETIDKFRGGAHWGLGVPRRKIKGAVALIHKLDNHFAEWAADNQVRRGNAAAFRLPIPQTGDRRRVFIQSMSDIFDLEVPVEWFAEAWDRIEVCDRIHPQLVTKRISAVEKRLAAIGRKSWPQHAGLMITVVDQAEASRDIPRLVAIKRKFSIPWVGLSIEPMLGAIDLKRALHIHPDSGGTYTAGRMRDCIDWVIAGGESGGRARHMDPAWPRSLRDQCDHAGVAFFMKQMTKKAEIPTDLRVRQFPAFLQ